MNKDEKRSFLLFALLAHLLILVAGIPLYLFLLAVLAMRAEERWFRLVGLHPGRDHATPDTISDNLSNITGGSVALEGFPGWFCHGFVVLGLVAYALAIVLGIEVVALLYYIRRMKRPPVAKRVSGTLSEG